MDIYVILFAVWPERCKQILKKWRGLTSDQKAPYLQKARDNRSVVRMKKAQQVLTMLFRLFVAYHSNLNCLETNFLLSYASLIKNFDGGHKWFFNLCLY